MPTTGDGVLRTELAWMCICCDPIGQLVEKVSSLRKTSGVNLLKQKNII